VQTKVLKGVTVVDGVQLTRPMVSLLVAHASGERGVRVSETDTLRALVARRLIRVNRANRPSRSLATPRGREVIAALLGQLATCSAEPTVLNASRSGTRISACPKAQAPNKILK